MTPNQLLEDVKDRFTVLYHNDADKLNRLLLRAMGTYSRKTGVSATTSIDFIAEEPAIDMSIVETLPAGFCGIVTAKDASGLWHEVGVDETAKTWTLFIQAASVSPISVEYFVDLREWDGDTALPNGVSSMLGDYLEVLIKKPNTEREREIYAQSGYNQANELPSRSELETAIKDFELSLEENAAFISSSVVW